jgi:hypothetical protein
MRSALASALQARGREAVTALQGLDPAKLAQRYVPTRDCMLERLDVRTAPANPVADRFVAAVLFAYREYWFRSLRAEDSPEANEVWLLDTLNTLVAAERGKRAANLDQLEPALEALISGHGYHPLLGLTRPLRELMLWKTETETRYRVRLPESVQPVTVAFLDDFASLGWAGFATCGRSHSGGWTRPDRLYAVRSAYDVGSEEFRVSYLAHEAQHFADNRRYPDLDRQDELEYRAKLTELAAARGTLYDLLDGFARNVSDDRGVPHSYANGRVVRGLAARLFADSTAAPAWRTAPPERINRAARELLREDTARR